MVPLNTFIMCAPGSELETKRVCLIEKRRLFRGMIRSADIQRYHIEEELLCSKGNIRPNECGPADRK